MEQYSRKSISMCVVSYFPPSGKNTSVEWLEVKFINLMAKIGIAFLSHFKFVSFSTQLFQILAAAFFTARVFFSWNMCLIHNDIHKIKMLVVLGDFNIFEYRYQWRLKVRNSLLSTGPEGDSTQQQPGIAVKYFRVDS